MPGQYKKKLAIPNVNVYSGQSGELWLEVEGVLYYNSKPYIAKTLPNNLLNKNNDDLFAKHFGVEKILGLFTCKYYWPKMRADFKKYVQDYDICMSNKVQKSKPYNSL